MNPKWRVGFDRTAAIDELIQRFSVWIGRDTKLTDNDGHIPWLDAARKRGAALLAAVPVVARAHALVRAVEALDEFH